MRPVDDGGRQLTAFVILKGSSRDDLVEVAEVGPEVTSWTDEGLERGTTYFYSVFAKNEVGNGDTIDAEGVTVPKPKKEDGPGFGAMAAIVTMVIIIMLDNGRRTREQGRGRR
jgi:hypothetical protein